MQLTWRQFKELSELNIEHFDSKFDLEVEELSIALDEDPEVIMSMTPSEFLKKRSLLQTYLNKPAKPKDEIFIDGFTFKKKPFVKFTLGEWIDLEYYITNQKWLEAVILIYRLSENTHFSEVKWEDWGSLVEPRINHFMETQFDATRGVIEEAIKWRAQIIEVNSELFSIPVEEEGDDLPDEMKMEVARARAEDEKKAKFAWERTIMDLCNNDVTKFQEVLNLPVILIFNILSMKKTQ
jgi:hypothetical protein